MASWPPSGAAWLAPAAPVETVLAGVGSASALPQAPSGRGEPTSATLVSSFLRMRMTVRAGGGPGTVATHSGRRGQEAVSACTGSDAGACRQGLTPRGPRPNVQPYGC